MLLVVVLYSAVFSNEYSPLSSKDKKQFRAAYNAIEIASDKGNYRDVALFIPSIKEKYVSILIDPDCSELVRQYNNLDILLERCRNRIKYDSLLVVVAMESGYEKIVKSQVLMDFLKGWAQDSLYTYHLNSTKRLIRAQFDAKATLDSYSQLIKLPYTDIDYLFSKRRKLEEQIGGEFMQLTASQDIDSIKGFMHKYPGVMSSDVNFLLEKSQNKLRSSILNHPSVRSYLRYAENFPKDAYAISEQVKKKLKTMIFRSVSIEAIEEYYTAFPGKDIDLEGALEDRIFKKLMATRDYKTGMFYLERFPNGIYINSVKAFMSNDTYSDNY